MGEPWVNSDLHSENESHAKLENRSRALDRSLCSAVDQLSIAAPVPVKEKERVRRRVWGETSDALFAAKGLHHYRAFISHTFGRDRYCCRVEEEANRFCRSKVIVGSERKRWWPFRSCSRTEAKKNHRRRVTVYEAASIVRHSRKSRCHRGYPSRSGRKTVVSSFRERLSVHRDFSDAKVNAAPPAHERAVNVSPAGLEDVDHMVRRLTPPAKICRPPG